MKKYFISLCILFWSQTSFAGDGNGLLVSLDELKYLDVDELQMKICAAPKMSSLFLKQMELGPQI